MSDSELLSRLGQCRKGHVACCELDEYRYFGKKEAFAYCHYYQRQRTVTFSLLPYRLLVTVYARRMGNMRARWSIPLSTPSSHMISYGQG